MPTDGYACYNDWLKGEQDRLLALALGYSKNREDAMDVVQSTLIKVLTQWPTFSRGPNAYANKIIFNAVASLRRDQRRRPTMDFPEVIAADPPPPERMLRDEQIRHVRAFILTLPPTLREVFIQYVTKSEGFRFKDAVRILGKSEKTVRKLLKRAEREFRRSVLHVIAD